MTDPYHEWDGAYVMGSLSPGERREYEQHLSTCAGCAAEVAALAGISGILSGVQPEQAMALLPGAATADDPVPPSLLPTLLASARRTRRQARRRVVALVAAAAAVAATVALVVPWLLGGSSSGPPSAQDDPAGRLVAMAQTVPSPITAEVVLYAEPWGTRIQLVCWYAAATPSASGTPAKVFQYALHVTDASGADTQVASWSASAGTRSAPVATTRLMGEEIDRIDVRLVDTGLVLLEARP